MLSRALSLATVTLLIGCFAAVPALGAGDKSRGRQEPLPDFRGHLHRLPQEPAGSVEDRAGRIAAGLPAPALHHQHRHGLAARCLPDLQRRDRYPLWQASPRSKDAKAEARRPAVRAARPVWPPAATGAAAGGREARGGAAEAAKPDAEATVTAATPSGWRGRMRRSPPRTARLRQRRARPDGRKLSAKQRLGKRGKPGSEEPPKTDAAKTDRQGRAGQGRGDAKEDAAQERNRQGRGRQARGSQADRRGQVRIRQDRGTEGTGQRRDTRVAGRSGSPGHACAAGRFADGLRGRLRRDARAGSRAVCHRLPAAAGRDGFRAAAGSRRAARAADLPISARRSRQQRIAGPHWPR